MHRWWTIVFCGCFLTAMTAAGQVAQIPFVEDFEGGPTLESYWAITGTSDYRTQVTTAYLPNSGLYHLTMDDLLDGSSYSRNEATLTIDLAGYQNVELSFWAKEFNDEGNGPPPAPFTGGADFDGVAISEDGLTWYEVVGLRNLVSTYSLITVDLDAAIAAYGLSYSSTFRIRFNQYDDFSITTDGIAIDDISITGSAIDDLTVAPLQDFVSSGPEGGPFTPSSKTYTLTNNGAANLDWTATATAAWIYTTPGSGLLAPLDFSDLEVSFNSSTLGLSPGIYTDTVSFTNTTSGFTVSRDVSLEVEERLGEIEVTDSIAPGDDLDMPFGTVLVGDIIAEQVTVTNIDISSDLIVNNVSLGASGYIDDFEDGNLSEYTFLSGASHVATSAAAHDGVYGVEDSNPGSTPGWIYRDDPEVQMGQGETISYWVHFVSSEPAGRIYAGFGATAAGTYSIIAANNTNELLIQRNDGYTSYLDIGSVSQTWTLDKWYRLEVEWGIGGAITGFVYDSDGTTLLNTATALDNTYTSGGIAFRGFDHFYGDSVVRSGSSGGSVVLPLETSRSRSEPLMPDPADAIGWDEENVAYVYDVNAVRSVVPRQSTPASDPDLHLRVDDQFVLAGLPPLPIVLAPGQSFVFDVSFAPTAAGVFDQAIVIESGDLDEPEVFVTVSGTSLETVAIAIAHSPISDTTDLGPYDVSADVVAPLGLLRVDLNWSTDGGATFTAAPMANLGGDTFGTQIPGQPVGVTLVYYIEAEDLGGHIETDPVGAPANAHVFEVLGIPNLVVLPGSLDFILRPDETEIQVLRLENTGTAPADWSLAELPAGLTATNAGVKRGAPFVVPPASGRSRIDWSVEHDPSTLLVRFHDTVAQGQARRSVHDAMGARPLSSYRLIALDVVEVPVGVDLQSLAEAYAAQPGVAYAEPNYIVHADMIPNDPLFTDLWGLHNVGQTGGVVDADIDAPEAWDLQTGSHDVIVGVIDTGIDYTHPDLVANLWTNDVELNGVGGVDDDGNGIVDDIYGARWTDGTGLPTSGDPLDDHYHGTHVSGTIGAEGNNGLGVAGVSQSVRIMGLKFLDSSGDGYSSDAISALEYAVEMGAHLTSNSWGGGGFSQAMKDAIDAAHVAGQLFIAAAGNDGRDNDIFPHYPSSYDSDNVIAVANSNYLDDISLTK